MATLLQHFEVLISAWTERKDIDGVLACMTDEVIWHPAVADAPGCGQGRGAEHP